MPAPPASSTSSPLPPDKIGTYRVVQTLSPGKTYLAVADSGRNVVIKQLDDACLSASGQLHPTVRDRLSRVRELATPGIVNLLSVERDGPHAFLIWDHLNAQTLADWLAADPSLRQRRLAAREIVLTLESLHAAGIAHSAVHARNVLIDAQGRWWLTHVSPLLVTDVRDDVEATERLLEGMNLEADFPRGASSLRQLRLPLAGLIDARDEQASTLSDGTRDRHVRRRTLFLAAAIAGVAVAVSYAIFLWAR